MSEKIKKELNEICGKIVKSGVALRFHKRITMKRPFNAVPVGPKLFRNSTKLKWHAVTHLPEFEKPFQCDE